MHWVEASAGAARARPRVVERLASPRLTVVVFILLGAGALGVAEFGVAPTTAMVPPFALLGANLAAAIATNGRFRRDLPLLVFHLALVVLIGLFSIGRLTYFEGATTVTAGAVFENDFLTEARGPLHGDGPARLRFANDGFTERFPARGDHHATYNRVRWWDAEGKPRQSEIGDDVPLLLDGYRIYTTWRRGFSPLFLWQPDKGEAEYGTVQLQEMVSGAGFAPASAWSLPGGPEIWVMLDVEGLPAPEDGLRDALGADAIRHRLVVRIGEQRHTLQPGETLAVARGQLTYSGLGSWMGYRIVYDPTTPWLIATVLVAIGSLLWFYARLLGRRPVTENRN